MAKENNQENVGWVDIEIVSSKGTKYKLRISYMLATKTIAISVIAYGRLIKRVVVPGVYFKKFLKALEALGKEYGLL